MINNMYIGTSKFKKITEPVVGYKRSILRVVCNESGEHESAYMAPIQGPLKGERISFNADSLCPEYKFHKGKPSTFCKCGFYSYKDFNDALNHCPSTSFMLFKTVASGKILMYAKGVRAGHQRVEEVIVPGCYSSGCPMSPDRIYVPVLNTTKTNIMGMCKFHGKDVPAKTFAWLADIINSEMTNGEPPVVVRSLKSDVVPWDGKYEYKTFGNSVAPKEDTLNSYTKMAMVGAGAALGLNIMLDFLERKRR